MSNILDHLYTRGKVTVNGKDWGEYRKLRTAAAESRKLYVNFNDISVRDALAHLSFLSKRRFRVKSGDAEKIFSLSLQKVTLSEMIDRISAQTGVKIKETKKSASIKQLAD